MIDFQKLQVYQKSKENYKIISKLISTCSFDSELKDQLQKSAIGIMLKIAASSAASNASKQKEIFESSLGYVYECIAVLDLLKDSNELDEFSYLDYYGNFEELGRMLEKILRKL